MPLTGSRCGNQTPEGCDEVCSTVDRLGLRISLGLLHMKYFITACSCNTEAHAFKMPLKQNLIYAKHPENHNSTHEK